MKTKIHLGASIKVASHEIIKLEAQKNYTLIYFTNGKILLSSTNLGKLEQRLPPHAFFRANRSVVINLKYLSWFRIINPLYKRDLENNIKKETVLLSRRMYNDFISTIKSCA